MVMTKTNKKRNYVDTEEFYKVMLAWKNSEEFKLEKEAGKKPRPTDEILVKYCWVIINKYAYQRKWYNVPVEILEEAVPLALEFCIKYLHNFNEKKYKNPFTYVTQFTGNAILQSYNKDKKEKIERLELLTNTMSSATYIRSDGEIDLIAQGEFSQSNIKFLDNLKKDYQNK